MTKKDQDSQEPGDRKSAATQLVEIAEGHYTLGATDAGEAFAIPRTGHGKHIARRLKGGRQSLRAELAKRYYAEHKKAAPQQALADAMLVLEGSAQDRDPEELHLRVAEAFGNLYIDMGDVDGTVIKINSDGTTGITMDAPCLFQRTALTMPMPMPVEGGSLEELWSFVNVAEEDRPLLIAVLVASFIPDIPHPIPTMAGEQGTGKSTTTRMLVDLIDPTSVPLRKPPRDADGWVTAAAGSWAVAVDNLSNVPDWFSDSLCRAVTGDGDVRRALYTDGGLSVFSFRRQIMLTGIDFAGLRGDLAERLVLIQLHRILDRDRLEERDLEARWRDARPRILGALLDLLAGVWHEIPSLRLDSKPRMADFAKVLKAVDGSLGTNGFERYSEQAGEIALDTLDSPFVQELMLIDDDFEGTAAELLTLVTPADAEWRRPKDWPKTSRQVTTILTRDAPALRKQGWTVDDLGNRNHAKAKSWRVARPEIAGIPTPRHPRHPQGTTGAGVAGVAGDEYGTSQDDDDAPAGVAGVAGYGYEPSQDVQAAPAGVAGVAGDEYGTSQDDDRPLCSVCSKPNLMSPVSIERGYCEACRRALVATPKPMPGTAELHSIA